MGRFVYGLGSENIIFTVDDKILRALEKTVFIRLHQGKNFFLRGGGRTVIGGTRSSYATVWVSSASQFACHYDAETVLEAHEGLVNTWSEVLEEFGVLNLPGLESDGLGDVPLRAIAKKDD